jgi:hypothetical protein
MEEKTEESRETDALCRECGHAFKVHIDRIIFRDDGAPAESQTTECPVCGCGKCRIGR